MKLVNKVVVVTGASAGMGSQIVKLFVKEGASVVAVARRKERLDALVEELKNEAGKVVAYAGDISKKEDCEGMIDFAIAQFGKFDILINNAGVMDHMDPIGDVTDETYDKIMNINLYGPMCAMRKAVNVFKEQGNGGNIINISSVGSMHQAAGAIYGASKAGLNAMSKNTAFVYGKNNIRCNVIAPGSFATEISSSMGMPNMAGYEAYGKVIGLSPAPGDPVEIAKACLFLASDDSNYINGQIINVDGGWTSF